MIWGDYLHDPFNSYSPASYVIDVGKHYSCDIISALSSLLFCFLSVMNGKYCWGRVCLRREVPAWFPDRKTISTKTFEASYSQERWNWWDLRKYVDKGLEVALFPKKLVREGPHRRTCDLGSDWKQICWLSCCCGFLCVLISINDFVTNQTCQFEFWFMTLTMRPRTLTVCLTCLLFPHPIKGFNAPIAWLV